jgi:hypothetical protein
MADDFDEATSSCEKDRRSSQPNKQRKFTAYCVSEMLGAFGLAGRFSLSRHAREDNESASAMQSVRTRSENGSWAEIRTLYRMRRFASTTIKP